MIKFQKIKWCVQCRELLPLKCAKCVRHPNRKPKVQDVYNWPPILETRDCGCVRIGCQKEGCKNTMWRHTTSGRNGMCRKERQFCSRSCAAQQYGKVIFKQVEVPCGWCKKKVFKRLSEIKTHANSFCSKACLFMFMRKDKHEKEESENSKALLICDGPKHRGEITEHVVIKRDLYECVGCGYRRNIKTRNLMIK